MLSGGVRRVWNSGSGRTLHNRLTITRLDSLKEYNIYIASSRAPGVKCSWQIRAAGPPKVIGNAAAVLAAQSWRQGDNWVVFSGVKPDAVGTIAVYGKGEAGSGAGAFSGITLNGFQIIEAMGWLSPDKAIYDFGDPANNPGTRSVISTNNTGDKLLFGRLKVRIVRYRDEIPETRNSLKTMTCPGQRTATLRRTLTCPQFFLAVAGCAGAE